jgi:phosphatidylglycerophosphate synthase
VNNPGQAVKWFFVHSRDALARGLVRLGVTPNGLTWAGFVLTCGSAACLAAGASHQLPAFGREPGPQVSLWPVWAGVFLFLACAMDMLDGAVARIGNLRSDAGAALDSSIDRCSDAVLYIAIAAHFAGHANVTGVVLSVLALSNSFMISYAAARAENMMDNAHVGWWQRGERLVAFMIGCFSGHMIALLWQQALLPGLTAARRIYYTQQFLSRRAQGLAPPVPGPPAGWYRHLMPWRYPRLTWRHDVLCALNAAWIIVAPMIWPFFYGTGDPLREWTNALIRVAS